MSFEPVDSVPQPSPQGRKLRAIVQRRSTIQAKIHELAQDLFETEKELKRELIEMHAYEFLKIDYGRLARYIRRGDL